MNHLSVGIIGCGYIAQRAYFPLLSSWPDLTVEMVLSRTKKHWGAVRDRWPDLNLSTNLEDLTSAGVDAAFILTPVASHFDLCVTLLENGIHVFVEKPPARSSTETLTMAQMAEDKDLVLMVGFNRRYAPLVEAAQSLIKREDIRLCTVEKHRPGIQGRDLSEAYREDLIHQIDLLRFFCGEMTPLSTSSIYRGDKIVSAVSVLEGPHQCLGVLKASRESGSWQERVTLIGSGKTVQMDMFQRAILVEGGQERVIWHAESGTHVEHLGDRGFKSEIEHFLVCVQENKAPFTDGFEAAKTQSLQEGLADIDYQTQRRRN
ncbi:MAG: Gfo/Idh/MocA family oxidoreductase [Anaerolineales bacterium]